ncbi:MAG: macro domain-containing protein [Mogibacterium sp.]|nr:macro domain-containing protein [Mogibacterium sp.]
MALQIIRNNIINVEADAIVNTANPKVAVGKGVDLAIYEAAGWDRLLAARAEIGVMTPGQAAYTPAFDLNVKYIIHTVGPAWRGGNFGERETVAACYRNSLWLAKRLDCESIAFPLLATGTYGFPKDEALRIAMAEISGFLLENEMEVMLVVYDKESFQVSGKLFSDIKMLIDDSEVEQSVFSEPERRRNLFHDSVRSREPMAGSSIDDSRVHHIKNRRAKASKKRADAEEETRYLSEAYMDLCDLSEKVVEERDSINAQPTFPTESEALDERTLHLDKTFQEYLFMLIDRKGLSDPEVYKKANMDRKHFSKIRSNVDYQPSKKTALALAIALELSLDETRDLLLRAGLALSPSIMFDRIIEYCIKEKKYDIYEINLSLFAYDQPTLGA